MGEPLELKVGFDLPTGYFDQRPDDLSLPARRYPCESWGSATSQKPHKDCLGLIVEIMADRNFLGRKFLFHLFKTFLLHFLYTHNLLSYSTSPPIQSITATQSSLQSLRTKQNSKRKSRIYERNQAWKKCWGILFFKTKKQNLKKASEIFWDAAARTSGPLNLKV